MRPIPWDQSLLFTEASAVSLPKWPRWMDRYWRERRHASSPGLETDTCSATHFCHPTFVQGEVGRAAAALSVILSPPGRKQLVSVSVTPTPGISQTLAFLKDQASSPEPLGAQNTAVPGLPTLLCSVTVTHRLSLWSRHRHSHFTGEEIGTHRSQDALKTCLTFVLNLRHAHTDMTVMREGLYTHRCHAGPCGEAPGWVGRQAAGKRGP